MRGKFNLLLFPNRFVLRQPKVPKLDPMLVKPHHTSSSGNFLIIMFEFIFDKLQHKHNRKHKQNIQKCLLNIILQLNGLSLVLISGFTATKLSFIYFAFIMIYCKHSGRADRERDK